MKTFKILLFMVLSSLLLLVSCSRPDDDSVSSLLGFSIPKDSVDQYLIRQMAEKKIPGLSIAIINDGQVVYRQYAGYSNLADQKLVDSQTIFEGASMSKSLFAFFTMTFVDNGQLDLDKPLYLYLPYKDLAHDERYKQITARMVLSHRTGLPNWRENEPDGKLRFHFDPGTTYLYSGEAYQYLAMTLAKIARTDWDGLEALFQQRVAEPLGMNRTVFIQNEYTKLHKASPYDENGEAVDWQNNYWHQKNEGVFGAASTIHSDPEDFARWMTGVMEHKILSEQAYIEMLKVHSEIPGEEADYTLGFYKLPFPFGKTYLHGGNNTGFTCTYVMNTDKKWGYVVFTNSEYGQQLGEEMLFYLLAGPDLLMPSLMGAVILLLLVITCVFLCKKIIRLIKNKRR